MHQLPERAARWLEDGFRRRTWGKWLWSRTAEKKVGVPVPSALRRMRYDFHTNKGGTAIIRPLHSCAEGIFFGQQESLQTKICCPAFEKERS